MNTEAIRRAIAKTRSDITDEPLEEALLLYYYHFSPYYSNEPYKMSEARNRAMAFLDKLALAAAQAAYGWGPCAR